MKFKTFMKNHKSFCVFSILALLIILAAIFAPVITGGVSPTEAVLKDALQPPARSTPSAPTRWAATFLPV